MHFKRNVPHTGLEPLTYKCPVIGSGLSRGTVVSNSRIRKNDHFPRNYEEAPVPNLRVKKLRVVSNSRIREKDNTPFFRNCSSLI